MNLEFTNHSAAAQTCFNSLTHGACALSLFIPGEDPAQFKQLVDSYFETHRPATDDHAALVFDLAHARWMLWRRLRAQANREHSTYNTSNPADWDAGTHHLLNLMDRYTIQAHRAFQRALSNVRAVQKDHENSARWRARLAAAQEKVQSAAEKHEAFMALKKMKIEEARHMEAERIRKDLPPLPFVFDRARAAALMQSAGVEIPFVIPTRKDLPPPDPSASSEGKTPSPTQISS